MDAHSGENSINGVLSVLVLFRKLPLQIATVIITRGSGNGGNIVESILNSIKKLLMLSEDDTSFDTDIIIHINSVLSIYR